jgi:NDP-sugar pyrophosphorylase family protein
MQNNGVEQMQAIILAAGKSTRTYPLTLNTPKPLLPIMNKPVLQHNLEQLVGIIDEAVIIVGFGKDQIIERFGSSFESSCKGSSGTGSEAGSGTIKLTYVEQK